MNTLEVKLKELIDSGLTKEHIDLLFKGEQHIDNVKRFNNITSEMAEIYAKKNKDYGGSFDKSLDEDGLLVSKVRLGDKFYRFGQLIKNPAEVKDESLRDTLLDAANYAIMTVMWMDAKAKSEKMIRREEARAYIQNAVKKERGDFD